MDVSAGHSGSLQSSSGGDDDDSTHEFHSPPGPGPSPSPSPSDSLISSFFQFNNNNSSSSYELLMTTHLQPHHQHPPLSHMNMNMNMNMSMNMNMNDSLSHTHSHSHFSFSQLPPAAAAPAPTPTATASAPISHGPSPPTPSPSTSSSRKRTRASRRAPTTVLTTDTSNFRAMVQEFTGIPAPPFAPSPSHHLHLQQPPYLLRPFAHRLNTSTPPATATMPTCTSNNSPPLQTPCTTHDQAHGGQTSTLLNMPIINSSQSQSQLLSFQSLLHDQSQQLIQPKSVSSTPAAAAAAHALLGSSDKLHQGGWPGRGSGSVSASADGPHMPESIQRSACSDYAAASTQQEQHESERAASSSCKLKISSTAGSSSEFVNANKQESVREEDRRVVGARRSRGEGMVDSWLCSSSSSDHC